MFFHPSGNKGLDQRGLHTGEQHAKDINSDQVFGNRDHLTALRKHFGKASGNSHQKQPQDRSVNGCYNNGTGNGLADPVLSPRAVIIAYNRLQALAETIDRLPYKGGSRGNDRSHGDCKRGPVNGKAGQRGCAIFSQRMV